MTTIYLKKTGTVKFKITVTGNIVWVCALESKNISDNLDETKNCIELGNPEFINNSVSDWEVKFDNPGSNVIEPKIKIEWIQNDRVINKWEPKGNSKSDSCFYKIKD